MNNTLPTNPIILRNVYIGYVDLLGYTVVQESINRHGLATVQALTANIFNPLEQSVEGFNKKNQSVRWVRYGDGYFFYSDNDNIIHLERVLKDASIMLGSSIISYGIPLRIVITKGDVTIDDPFTTGLTISGKGWDKLRKLEGEMDWMGGWLYHSPQGQVQYDMLMDLVATTQLIVWQEGAKDKQYFKPPFKNSQDYKNKDWSWFLNWYKYCRPEKDIYMQRINNWWTQLSHNPDINNNDAVKTKQLNSIAFADYCCIVNRAANLMFFSKTAHQIDISKIEATID